MILSIQFCSILWVDFYCIFFSVFNSKDHNLYYQKTLNLLLSRFLLQCFQDRTVLLKPKSVNKETFLVIVFIFCRRGILSLFVYLLHAYVPCGNITPDQKVKTFERVSGNSQSRIDMRSFAGHSLRKSCLPQKHLIPKLSIFSLESLQVKSWEVN